MRTFVIAATLVVAAMAGRVPSASAGEHPPGCFSMLLVNVIDGDTVYGYVDTSDPEVAIRVKLRIVGIDTPETGGRAQCAAERSKAAEAKLFLERQLEEGLARPVRGLARACNIASDKYGGRRLGKLEVYNNHRWVDLGALMISKGLAFPYDGGKRGRSWCDCLDDGRCPKGYQG
ncbi:MAG: thermonuclease family protein [Hyphomicrobiaceae bacterium]